MGERRGLWIGVYAVCLFCDRFPYELSAICEDAQRRDPPQGASEPLCRGRR